MIPAAPSGVSASGAPARRHLLALELSTFAIAGPAALTVLAGSPGRLVFALALFLALPVTLLQVLREVHAYFARPRSLPEATGKGPTCVVCVPVILRTPPDADSLSAFIQRNAEALRRAASPLVFLVDGPPSSQRDHLLDPAIQARVLARIGDPQEASVRPTVLWRNRQRTASGDEWAGWERKRGKVHRFLEMNAGQAVADFIRLGAPATPIATPYVFVADIDTTLLPGALERLVAKARHPENDAAILTPRILTPLAERRGRFTAMMGGRLAADEGPMPQASLRQDRLGSDLFFGKGLIHGPRFLERLGDRLPDGIILSHDHIEGMMAGSALASDVAVLESQPQTMSAWLHRQHRWIRGDAQNLAFVLPRVWQARPPRGAGLDALDRLELVFNCLGHFKPAAVLLMIADLVWTAPTAPVIWSAPLLLLWSGLAITVLDLARPRPPRRSRTLALDVAFQQLRAALGQLSFLPQSAVVAVHGLIIGLWRLLSATDRGLEWPAGGGRRTGRWSAVGLLVGAAILAGAVSRQGEVATATGLLAIWTLSPFIWDPPPPPPAQEEPRCRT
ncbi:hypothetical protein [Brevundimonas sp.]|uniref:hypothetical protein n=1 Tax=Brevundimonas sp. TaxID=1871086 RepID=UPI003F7191F8